MDKKLKLIAAGFVVFVCAIWLVMQSEKSALKPTEERAVSPLADTDARKFLAESKKDQQQIVQDGEVSADELEAFQKRTNDRLDSMLPAATEKDRQEKELIEDFVKMRQAEDSKLAAVRSEFLALKPFSQSDWQSAGKLAAIKSAAEKYLLAAENRAAQSDQVEQQAQELKKTCANPGGTCDQFVDGYLMSYGKQKPNLDEYYTKLNSQLNSVNALFTFLTQTKNNWRIDEKTQKISFSSSQDLGQYNSLTTLIQKTDAEVRALAQKTAQQASQ